jgi:ASC-1-like (ASCH) protein
LVKSGQKVYEGRCYWKKAKDYKVGDILHIIRQNDHSCDDSSNVSNEAFNAEIIGLHIRKTFREALEDFGLEKVLPGVTTIENGVEIYHQYVSEKTQQENGIVMIELRVLSDNYIHLLEPQWNCQPMMQILGRATRSHSHASLLKH